MVTNFLSVGYVYNDHASLGVAIVVVLCVIHQLAPFSSISSAFSKCSRQ